MRGLNHRNNQHTLHNHHCTARFFRSLYRDVRGGRYGILFHENQKRNTQIKSSHFSSPLQLRTHDNVCNIRGNFRIFRRCCNAEQYGVRSYAPYCRNRNDFNLSLLVGENSLSHFHRAQSLFDCLVSSNISLSHHLTIV